VIDTRRAAIVGGLSAAGLFFAWILFFALPRWVANAPTASATAPAPAAAGAEEPERKIKARLFYVSEDGHGLTGVEREVAFGADPGAQARAILDAQIAAVDAPLLSAVPAGTKLRAVYVANGDAYVDLTGEVVTAHPGGSLNEQLTVQTLVSAVMINLPAITGVQILVDGKEVDTLAGHVDLRQPLMRKPDWVQ
jgi:sporulation and spore germination protein